MTGNTIVCKSDTRRHSFFTPASSVPCSSSREWPSTLYSCSTASLQIRRAALNPPLDFRRKQMIPKYRFIILFYSLRVSSEFSELLIQNWFRNENLIHWPLRFPNRMRQHSGNDTGVSVGVESEAFYFLGVVHKLRPLKCLDIKDRHPVQCFDEPLQLISNRATACSENANYKIFLQKLRNSVSMPMP